MRILFVQIENTGGIHLYTASLANALSKTQDVHFLLGKRLMNENYYNKSIKFHYVSSPQSYIKMFFHSLNPLTYLGIYKAIKSVNPDVIHIAVPFLWIAVILPFLRRYPLIVTEHDPALHSGTSLIVKSYMIPSIWLTRKMVGAIIVHGNRMKQIVVKSGVAENKVRIIPHGEFSYYRKWYRREASGDKSVLYFGKITKYKGLQYLIQAVPLIISKIPDIRIVIVGKGDLKKYLPPGYSRKYFEIHNRYVRDEEVAGFFQKAAVVVLPYIDGTQSGIVPIAFAFGKPVVVTDVGSIPEEVDEGETGLIVPPRDPPALAQAIVNLLNDDELRTKMGENALNKTKNELSWDIIAEKTLLVYEQVMHRK